MATFNSNNAAIQYYGRIGAPNPTYQQFGIDSECVFVVNATDCTLLVQGTSTDAFEYSVDGGAFTTATLAAANTPATIAALVAGSAADHTIVLKVRSGKVGYTVVAAFITATGGAATIRAPSTSDGFGYGPYVVAGSAGTYLSVDSWQSNVGGNYTSPNNYFNVASPGNGGWSDSRFRLLARGGTLKMWVYLNGAAYQWYIDGVKQTGFSLANTSRWGFHSISLPDGSAEHVYEVQTCNQPQAAYWDGVMVTGASSAFSSSAVTTELTLAGFGDSITGASVNTGPDSTVGHINLVARSLGYKPFNRGIGGNAVSGGVAPSMSNRTGDITNITPEPKYCIVLAGTNDLTSAGGTGTIPGGTYGAAFQSMLTALLAGTTATKFYVIGILPRTGVTAATLVSWNGSGNGTQGSIAAVNNARLIYVDPTSWQLNGASGTDYSTNYSDGLHPNAVGYTIIANKLLTILNSSNTFTDISNGFIVKNNLIYPISRLEYLIFDNEFRAGKVIDLEGFGRT